MKQLVEVSRNVHNFKAHFPQAVVVVVVVVVVVAADSAQVGDSVDGSVDDDDGGILVDGLERII